MGRRLYFQQRLDFLVHLELGKSLRFAFETNADLCDFFSLIYLKINDDSFRILHLYCLTLQETIRYFAIWIILVFVLTSLLNVTNLQ